MAEAGCELVVVGKLLYSRLARQVCVLVVSCVNV
jgi:hypothetical protein